MNIFSWEATLHFHFCIPSHVRDPFPLRGAVVEWLEQLDYGAESRRKVVSSRMGFAMRTGKLCQPSSEWVPVSYKGKLRQRKERDGLHLSSAVPKIQWDSNPHCPYGY